MAAALGSVDGASVVDSLGVSRYLPRGGKGRDRRWIHRIRGGFSGRCCTSCEFHRPVGLPLGYLRGHCACETGTSVSSDGSVSVSEHLPRAVVGDALDLRGLIGGRCRNRG